MPSRESRGLAYVPETTVACVTVWYDSSVDRPAWQRRQWWWQLRIFSLD